MRRIYWIAISIFTVGLLSCGEANNAPGFLTGVDTKALLSEETPAKPTPLNAELLDAVRHNDSRRVLSLLEAGANVNHEDESGFTVLVNALAEHELEFVEELVAQGAVTNFSILMKEQRLEPSANQLQLDLQLLEAVAENSWDLARKFIIQGANINAVDHEGFTVLATALASLEMDLVDLLLSHGAHI